ncbi:MAG: FAD-binding protein [Saprospiraceae bacterium]
MHKTIELTLLPHELDDSRLIRERAVAKAQANEQDVTLVKVVKRSLDARGSRPVFRLKVEVFEKEPPSPEPVFLDELKDVSKRPPVIIVGAGPAGYFAALELIELGFKPIVLDRGKDVRQRRRDLRAIQQFGKVNPDSNYCFGEGGAGTYSDGKLYTRSHKRGHIYKAMKLLVEHGAKADILVDAHPHIGSNKLPHIVANIRQTILEHGGEVHFDARVTDFILRNEVMEGVIVNDKLEFRANAVILATGHSARDIYQLLHRRQIVIQPKPFALGVRIEHPQPLIDKIQYGIEKRGTHLPASSYRLACQVNDRGVFSFCMCPGGLVVPAATSPGEIVVNGMSMSRRDSPFANSGTVVQVELEDLHEYDVHGVFKAMVFQKEVEQSLFKYGDGSQKAPALRLTDFVRGKVSTTLPPSSYIPGLYPAPLHELLPDWIYDRLKKAVRIFGKKMPGYFSEEVNVIATESRTSAPVRIPRHKATYMHINTPGLFPAGEGAGYAGGIISAAMDGQNVARAVAQYMESRVLS